MGIKPLENEKGVGLVWVVGGLDGDQQLHTQALETVGCTTWNSAWNRVGNLSPVGLLVDR